MDDREETRTGSYYRFGCDGLAALDLMTAVIANGPAFSPDGRLIYLVDTLSRRVCIAPVNDDGSFGSARPFAEIELGAGYPDRPTVDREGCLWLGLFAGWGMRRYIASYPSAIFLLAGSRQGRNAS